MQITLGNYSPFSKIFREDPFKNGREFAAWLGLVPRQHSTGGKPLLLGISKRGDRYLRKLLIHGARAVVRTGDGKQDGRRRWLQGLIGRGWPRPIKRRASPGPYSRRGSAIAPRPEGVRAPRMADAPVGDGLVGHFRDAGRASSPSAAQECRRGTAAREGWG